MSDVVTESGVLDDARVHAYGAVLRRVLSLKRESDVKILHGLFSKFLGLAAIAGVVYASIPSAHAEVAFATDNNNGGSIILNSDTSDLCRQFKLFSAYAAGGDGSVVWGCWEAVDEAHVLVVWVMPDGTKTTKRYNIADFHVTKNGS